MKKIIGLLTALLMCASIAACGDNEGPKNDTNEVKNSASENAGASNEDYFIWSDYEENTISGLTEEGLKQSVLVIPENCVSIYGLDENENLKSVTFTNPDTELDSSIFYNCPNLDTVVLPANLKVIEHDAFRNCTSLKTIEIPESVTEIGSDVFYGCTSLESIELPDGVTTLESKAFYQCESLKEIVIPNSVEIIEESAFEGCKALEEITFPESLKTIESSAFQYCESLKSVKLSEGVATIDSFAFANCDALEEIYLPASIEELNFSSLMQLHKTNVYVVEGSYADTKLPELMEPDNLVKMYQ